MPSAHTLTVTLRPCGDAGCSADAPCSPCVEEPDVVHALACPGVDEGHCLMYLECMPCTSSQDEALDDALWDEEPQHGVVHTRIGGMWCTPTDPPRCFAADGDFADAAAALTSTPGVYRVWVEWDEDAATVDMGFAAPMVTPPASTPPASTPPALTPVACA